MNQVALGFIPEPMLVQFEKILPSRKLPGNIDVSRKYKQVLESIRSIGLIEPLTPEAKAQYNAIYVKHLSQDHGIERVNAMLERRAPLLLRLAMVFAMCDKTIHIETAHLDAANAWIKYFADSVQFVFTTASESVRTTEAIEHSHLVLNFLSQRKADSQ